MKVWVQQQEETVLHCGLFSITCAISLANSEDPTEVKFAQQSNYSF